ncbi:MAG: bifunctional enoyl-CoA hydratase/phosphate acetyltransferase [Burkholderiales bacterium]|nr:bifunctional enoyl-CoA hydratase/phosphate acetyltransferase [Burkholderiales bacterium]
MSCYTFATRLINQAKKLPNKTTVGIIHPCSDYALSGAIAIKQENLAIPILIGPINKIKSIALQNTLDISGIDIIDVPHSHAAVDKAIELVNGGKINLLMKGSLHTDELMHPILDSKTGLKTDIRVTHCCVMDIPSFNRPLLVADIAINVAPDLECKIAITQNAINLALAIGLKNIKVAILSADEQVHFKIQSSLDAASLSKMAERGQIKNAIIDGPLSFDAAISEDAKTIKNIKSKIAGFADILIAPEVETGNAIVKQFKYFANSIMPGIVIGAKVPIILTSRADDSFTRLTSCALGILYANWYRGYVKDKNEYSHN